MRAVRCVPRRPLVAAVLLCLASSPAFAGSILNPGFDTPTAGLAGPTYPTSISGADLGGISSAADWLLFNDSAPTTSTELLASTDPNGSGFMISVASAGSHNDLYQFFSETPRATASIDVFVLSGTVGLALYESVSGAFVTSTTSSGLGRWETLELTTPATANALYIYTGPGGASFYADNVGLPAVSSVPEPSSFVLGALGLTGMIGLTVCRPKRSNHA
jgi:hypothetical protein